ncbi:hypothetical protein [Desulfosporosinus youngiae]|uniref:hypothetical protein n=1 Tax=Desulfosporosinus youngiae TaxID=339862 RepID=UPI0009FE1823|nr:hypothetical protein [Desulfosporosinus youngiae]
MNSSHGEAIKAHKPVRGNGATGSHQVLPRGLAESRAGEWVSLGVLSERMWEKLPDPRDLFSLISGAAQRHRICYA